MILAIVLLNGILGYVQEARAEQAVAALRAMAAAEATVLRDGERRRVPAAEVVPGDVLLIEEGDTIPADGRLLQTTALQTAEAALTGESLPVAKDDAPIAGGGRRSATARTWSSAAPPPPTAAGRAMVTATGMRHRDGAHRRAAAADRRRGDPAAAGARPHRAGARAWSSSRSPS